MEFHLLHAEADCRSHFLISTLALVNPQLQTLSLEEWEMVKETCEVLQPFEEVTVELSAERYVKIVS